MVSPVQRECRNSAWNGWLPIECGRQGRDRASGLRQAETTNNVTIWGFMRQFERRLRAELVLSPSKLLQNKGIGGCASMVTSGRERGMRLAIDMAVPRQGYGRN